MIVEIILGILLVITSYTTFNQFRKVERLESWIESYAERIQDTQSILDEIDNSGSFEADDEIGVIFESIKGAVNQLDKITDKEI
jgi:hypothetical protein|tara:strand:- start:194 stop:445 length:252 start_codon:yes stop_codon:yes gene_type:complete